jgi:multidrug efflux pump subunit AcrA (membrane-fusion protein)
LKEGKARRREVTLGSSFGNSRQVESGVSPGEAVIVDAPAELKDDAAVTAAGS